MAKRTAEDVCFEYYDRIQEVRRLKRWMNDRANFCEHYEPVERPEYSARGVEYPGYEGTSKNKCLEEYDQQDPIPSDGFPSEQSAYLENEMCAKRKERLDQRGYLWMAKDAMLSARRSVEAVGKRVAQWKAERAEAGR